MLLISLFIILLANQLSLMSAFKFSFSKFKIQSSSTSLNALLEPLSLCTGSKKSKKFYGMVTRFATYNDEDISSLESERLQALILGGREALYEPDVLRAFAILYEKSLPVRFGGDILFDMLDKIITETRESKAPGEAQSSRQEAEGEQEAPSSSSVYGGRSNKLVLDGIIARHEYSDEERAIHNRFLDMVETFSRASDRWNPKSKDNLSSLDFVIMGCFAGAKNRGLVTALSILYEDYLPLRLAGDVIFKLVSKAL
jgi:hypothetical protein